MTSIDMAYALFASEVDVDALTDAQIRAAIDAQLDRCCGDLVPSIEAVAEEYNRSPSTATTHMTACLIRTSRLAGVRP